MRNNNWRWALPLIPLFLFNLPAIAAQSESPVACVEGPSSFPLVYGDYTTGCEIGPSALDLDPFVFDGVAGDVIRLSVLAEGRLDARVELFDPTGVIVSDTFCNSSTVGCSLKVDETLAVSGQYLINVSDNNSVQTDAYTLQLERIPPIVPAQPLDYAVPTDDTISPATDLDFFAFNANAGNTIRLSLLTQSRLDGRVEVRDPNGAVVYDEFCNAGTSGCTLTTDLSLPITGTYLIHVSDFIGVQANDYTISINCIFGPCPSVPPLRPECDIQLSQSIYLDGETLTADVFRYANLSPDPVAFEWKVWLDIPGIGPIGIVDFPFPPLPSGTDVDFGPLPLLPFDASLPRGEWELSCRLVESLTGRLLFEDRNFFELQ